MAARLTQYGEAFVGEGAEAAHLNTVLGRRGSAVETAWTTALATPREGHVPFVVVAQPNIPVYPFTLFVNKATIASKEHAALTWGAAQLGVASGVLDAVHQGVVDEDQLADWLLIAAVWVDPSAVDADKVYEFNRQATSLSLIRGQRRPKLGKLLKVRDTPINGYYVPATLRQD